MLYYDHKRERKIPNTRKGKKMEINELYVVELANGEKHYFTTDSSMYSYLNLLSWQSHKAAAEAKTYKMAL